jgi:tripartite-type tricarboxylate transporter receptor subunit TctC
MRVMPMAMRAVAVLLMLAPTVALAQTDFPNRPLRLLVGFPPGGSTDVLSRTLANEARKALGQDVIIVNKPGASGALAIVDLVTSPADGYTIAMTPSSTLTLAHEFQQIRPDLLEYTDALLTVGRQRIGIAVKAESDIKTFKDLVERARKEPGKVSLGIPGAGTMTDLISRAVFKEAGAEVNIVPFNGDASVATAMLGDHVTAGAMSAGGWNPQIAGGKMRLLASMEQERAEIAPDVPTMIELGYPLKGDAIQYLLAPKNLPPAIRQKLTDIFAEATKSAAFIDIAKQNALYDARLITGTDLDAYLLKDRANNAMLVEKLGLKKK